MTWRDSSSYEGRWHMEDRVDDTNARDWDRFFMKSIPEQRAFMKEFMRKYPELLKIRPILCAPAHLRVQNLIKRHASSPAQLTHVL